MALQRANWLEKQPARSKMRAILQVIKSGTLWQTPWTDLPFGLNRDCSSEAQFHNAPNVRYWHLSGHRLVRCTSAKAIDRCLRRQRPANWAIMT